MKVSMNLKKFEMWDLVDFIETTYPGHITEPDAILRKICLTELLSKLKRIIVMVKPEYRVKINLAHLLALRIHALQAEYPDPTVWITINKIISITGAKLSIKGI